MNYQHVLTSLMQAETMVREAFIKTAEYHKTEVGIYYDCQFMSSVSEENIAIIKNLLSIHSVEYDPGSADLSLLTDQFYPGSNLADDLTYIMKLKLETEEGSRSLLNSSSEEDKAKGEILRRNSQKQISWLSEYLEESLSSGKRTGNLLL
ncbi:MAG TPA: hypothetical protein VK213_00250 [Bacteroidales bacterium]|nr:hypothetical protein [Bacteroidales bacterium]